jgi:hypothetical protein
LLKNLPKGYQEDAHGNYYLLIGDNPSTMFTCHLDTADRTQKRVNHVFDGDMIRTDGTSILGADDKAGMTVISYMISKGIPGLYYFFIGEEVGCIGSGRLSRDWKNNKFSNHITKCVSFDRRGTDSIITHQMFGRCCSEKFAIELSKRMNDTGNGMKMSPDSTGILTDSAKFMSLIPECTNISVGYYNEHSNVESQDIEFLKRLCKTVVNMDWETLPIERDQNSHDDYDDYDDWGFWGGEGVSARPLKDEYVSVDKNWSIDNFTHVSLGGKTTKVYMNNDQITHEKNFIFDWLKKQDEMYDVFDIIWNGHSLYAESTSGKAEYIGSREDLMEYLPELKTIPRECISEKITLERKEKNYGFHF